ncbi:hypothetical protein PInf_000655 [Phytophthora infestans]|nr:hypothetical protein PInf_000655 [Phytophthora infestans]
MIYPTETSLRVKRGKLLLEYRPTLHFIKGLKNVGVGAFWVIYQKRAIALDSLRDDLIFGYHLNLSHSASVRQFWTMHHTFYWSNMETISQFVKASGIFKSAKLH